MYPLHLFTVLKADHHLQSCLNWYSIALYFKFSNLLKKKETDFSVVCVFYRLLF